MRRILGPDVKALRVMRNRAVINLLHKSKPNSTESRSILFRKARALKASSKKLDYRLGRNQYFKPTSALQKIRRTEKLAKPKL
jgi:hypothetical protein